jgi:L-ascorbate metabolism protein UlaG (beta-lactamase superfamily)
MAVIIVVLLALASLPFIIGAFLSGPKYRGPATDHFDGKKFFTPGGVPPHGLSAVSRWMVERKRSPWNEDMSLPVGKRPLNFFNDGIRITFINHSTFLIQADGVNILTDPVWSLRTSPFSFSGPRRMRPPGIKLEDLPRIDYVLLSHNHYDHLDLPTLRVISGAHHPEIITPLGVRALLDSESIEKANDMDWWEEKLLKNNLSITAVPAQHFSGRGALDRDASLWCGYVINTSAGKIYFAGDTGHHPSLFHDIGARCGPLAISIIPIGAFKPEWFMSPVHTSPEEAVKIHLEVKSKLSIACHFGTFPMADENPEETMNALLAAKKKLNVADDDFIVLKEGEPFILEHNQNKSS